MKKIVIIGPESTGKSSLCEALAKHYNTIWCPEYAREYLLNNGTNYSYENLLAVAKGQIELEERYTEKAIHTLRQLANKTNTDVNQFENCSSSLLFSNLLFIDTDMYVMKVWCEYVFNKCHEYILEQIAQRKYEAYLLCNTDLPWTQDELREYPDEKNRIELFNIYKDILVNQSTPFAIISGQGNERVVQAIDFINSLN